MAFLALLSASTLAGCSSEQIRRGWMPGNSDREITNLTGRMTHLWVGTWITAMLVGILVWGLMLWCMAVYRRRKGETAMPVQLRYHLPIEMLFTVAPIFMVGSLFAFTARDMAIIQDTSKTPDMEVTVVGKQWAWDFNYTSAGVFDTTTQVDLRKPGPVLQDQENIPVLYLPVNKNVQITLQSRDVAHSFWVPSFLYKKDLIPGHTNRFQVVPQVEGTYTGKCAELCGEYHSEMLFNVKVVSEAEYNRQMSALRAKGQTGSLPVELGRSGMPGEGEK